MGGPGSGPKPKSLNRDNAMRSLTNKLPKAIRVISDTMTGKQNDRLRYEAALSIKDAVLGKARQATDFTLDTDAALNLAIFNIVMELASGITGGYDALQEPGEEERLSEGQSEETSVNPC